MISSKIFVKKHFEFLDQFRAESKFPGLVRVVAVRRYIQANGRHLYEVEYWYRSTFTRRYLV
jgi:hypothetical protein